MSFLRKARSKPAPVFRPNVNLTGLARELDQIACESSDPFTRANIAGLIPRVARMERTNQELIAEGLAGDVALAAEGAVQ